MTARWPENYTGYAHTEGFASPGGILPGQPHRYTAPAKLKLLCRPRRYADLANESLVWTGKCDAEVGIIAVHLGRLTASAGRAQSQLRTAKRPLDLRR
jgi:hypothetical protein